jgi:prolyl oligopeptidase
VWDDRPDPQAWPAVMLTRDGRWLVVHVEVGYRRIDVHALDRESGVWTTLIGGVDARTQFSESADGSFLVGITDLNAPRGRVVRVKLTAAAIAEGTDAWQTIVVESEHVLSELAVTRRRLLLASSSEAVDTVQRLDIDGRPLDPPVVSGIDELISVVEDGLVADVDADEQFVVVDSFDAPTALWRVAAEGLATPAATTAHGRRLTGGLSVRRVSYPSADGTDVGLFLIHRDDVTPNADTPAILSGYGGFTITQSPGWQPRIAAWCSAGGRYAVAGLRGGLEHGEEWHKAGRAATSRTSSTTSTPVPTTSSARGSPAGSGWPSSEARTAGCSSAPRSRSDQTCARRCSAPSPCST